MSFYVSPPPPAVFADWPDQLQDYVFQGIATVSHKRGMSYEMEAVAIEDLGETAPPNERFLVRVRLVEPVTRLAV